MTISSKNFCKQSRIVHCDLQHQNYTLAVTGSGDSEEKILKKQINRIPLALDLSADRTRFCFDSIISSLNLSPPKNATIDHSDKIITKTKESFEENMRRLVYFIEKEIQHKPLAKTPYLLAKQLHKANSHVCKIAIRKHDKILDRSGTSEKNKTADQKKHIMQGAGFDRRVKPCTLVLLKANDQHECDTSKMIDINVPCYKETIQLPPLRTHLETFEHTGKTGVYKLIDDMVFKTMCSQYNVWGSEKSGQ